MNYVTGETIRDLREKRGLTQKALAELLHISHKTVSKWETNRGLPDVSLLADLAAALQVSVAELLTGGCVENRNRSGNLRRMRFYVCPVCGNVIQAVGEGAFSCCGILLPPVEAEPSEADHEIKVELMDGERYVYLDHPMSKGHYLTFMAYVTSDRVEFVKLYPEQSAAARFSARGHGMLYACCNRHGLFSVKI